KLFRYLPASAQTIAKADLVPYVTVALASLCKRRYDSPHRVRRCPMKRILFQSVPIIFSCLALHAYAQRARTVNPVEAPTEQTQPRELSNQDFASRIEEEKNSGKSSYEFLEAAAYNVIAGENDAKNRMAYIERFTPAFPKSRFEEQVTSYAMVSLCELKDAPRLISFGEKTLAANPNSLPA